MYLVCYDITSDRVRNKIVKTLEGYGRRVQYSVFECDLDEKRYKELYGKLLRIMQGVEAQNCNFSLFHHINVICFYYICKNCMGKKQIIGVPKKPEGWPDEEVIII